MIYVKQFMCYDDGPIINIISGPDEGDDVALHEPAPQILNVTLDEFAEFVRGVQDGWYDHLIAAMQDNERRNRHDAT